MVITNQLKNQHLLWRAGFGPMAEDIAILRNASQKSLLTALIKDSSKSPEYLDVADGMLKGLMMGIGDVVEMQNNEMSEEQKKQVRKQSVEDIKSLNLAWLNEMVNTSAQLREKMSLFWHGHFASRNLNIFYQQLLLDLIRRNALGNFGELLRAVSKSAAMLNFLNNNQNKKDHPNENFAREVMELFTMGRGHYTEQDVKEAARAFTGWGATLSGEFVFRRGQHDDGVKTFLGRSGHFDGDDVLTILLEKPETAVFVTRKLYRFFVNDTADESRISWLAGRFYQGNYDIGQLMHDLFSSDWFYEPSQIGNRIKSPVELMVGIRRMVPMTIENESSQLLVQRLLGQLLFYPPNVAGWPGGTSWIDSSTLMFRLRIPEIIYASGEFQLNPKGDDDQMMGRKEGEEGVGKRPVRRNSPPAGVIRATIHWDAYLKGFEQTAREDLLPAISQTLLQTTDSISGQTLQKYTDGSNRENFVKTATIRLMSTPEYQLC